MRYTCNLTGKDMRQHILWSCAGQLCFMEAEEALVMRSPASFVSPKPYSPTADDIADGSLLPTLD